MKPRDDLGHRTLDELEGVSWPPPSYASSLVTACHRLRSVPLSAFTAADLRLMISQQIGLPYLMPRALALLSSDPMQEAWFCAGDLLSAVLLVDPAFWSAHPGLRGALDELLGALPASDRAELGAALTAFQGDAR